MKEERSLEPGEAILYTWQDPTQLRQLVWSAGEKEQRNDLIKVQSDCSNLSNFQTKNLPTCNWNFIVVFDGFAGWK